MRAGRLRHRGVIQYQALGSPQTTGSGAPNKVWTNLDDGDGETWMSIEPLRGRELFAAQEHFAEVTTRIRIRYRSDVSAEMRVVHDAVNYAIGAVIDPELRHRELELMCTAGVTDGQ